MSEPLSTPGKKEKKYYGFAVSISVWLICLVGLVIAICVNSNAILPVLLPLDYILMGSVIFAAAVAINLSQTYGIQRKYGYKPPDEDDEIAQIAAKKLTVGLHSHYVWQVINAWMVFAPLYCTCTVIILSGDGFYVDSRMHVLVYSILSLVLSIMSYIVNPMSHAKVQRKVHDLIYAEYMRYIVGKKDEAAKTMLMEAIRASEEAIEDMVRNF